MKISKYFTLQELTSSTTAKQFGINNTPSIEEKNNLFILAQLLDEIREFINRPLFLTCAYRSPLLNRRVGGVENSVHTMGLAADLIIPKESHRELMCWLHKQSSCWKSEKYCPDQVISYPERGFIHVGLSPNRTPRLEFLSSHKKGSYTKYSFQQ